MKAYKKFGTALENAKGCTDMIVMVEGGSNHGRRREKVYIVIKDADTLSNIRTIDPSTHRIHGTINLGHFTNNMNWANDSIDALKVMLLDAKHAEWMLENDPQAYKQGFNAVSHFYLTEQEEDVIRGYIQRHEAKAITKAKVDAGIELMDVSGVTEE
jgi:hypothetical protein